MLCGVILRRSGSGKGVFEHQTENQEEVEHQNQNVGFQKVLVTVPAAASVPGRLVWGLGHTPAEAGQGCEEAKMEHVAPLIAPKILTASEHSTRQVG